MTQWGKALGAAVIFSGAVGVLLVGCQCSDSQPIAQIIQLAGSVEGDRSTADDWRVASVGDRFSYGHGVRTRSSSSAHLSVVNGAEVLLDAETVMRFLASPPGTTTPNLEVQSGEVEIDVGEAPVQLTTNLGVVKMEPRSRSRVLRTKDGYDVQISIGRAVFLEKDAADSAGKSIDAGQQLSIAFGQVEVEAIDESVDTETAPDTSTIAADTGALDTSSEPPDTEADTGSRTVAEAIMQSPVLAGYAPAEVAGKADFGVLAGRSFEVHSADVPVVAEFGVGKHCPDGGLIRVPKSHQVHLVERGHARVRFGKGLTRYQLHCVDPSGNVELKAARRGSVVVRRDSGRAPLVGKTPPSSVYADGRNYTIQYQDRPPRITFRWTKAPQDDAYILHVERAGSVATRIETAQPSHVFSPGALSDGTYALKFVSRATGRASRKTTVEIDFDNETPIAVVRSPARGEFRIGDAAEVAGVAARGWKVSVRGATLDVDRKNRFRGTVNYSGVYRGIAVRFEHRRHGMHLYLRRSGN